MSYPQPRQPNDDEARQKEAEAAAMRQRVMLALLDTDARQRLMNVRLVKPELASAVENYLINAASTGRLNRPLSDEELKQLLLRIQQPKRDFKIDRR
jgi:programmed cell death protein 5